MQLFTLLTMFSWAIVGCAVERSQQGNISPESTRIAGGGGPLNEGVPPAPGEGVYVDLDSVAALPPVRTVSAGDAKTFILPEGDYAHSFNGRYIYTVRQRGELPERRWFIDRFDAHAWRITASTEITNHVRDFERMTGRAHETAYDMVESDRRVILILYHNGPEAYTANRDDRNHADEERFDLYLFDDNLAVVDSRRGITRSSHLNRWTAAVDGKRVDDLELAVANNALHDIEWPPVLYRIDGDRLVRRDSALTGYLYRDPHTGRRYDAFFDTDSTWKVRHDGLVIRGVRSCRERVSLIGINAGYLYVAAEPNPYPKHCEGAVPAIPDTTSGRRLLNLYRIGLENGNAERVMLNSPVIGARIYRDGIIAEFAGPDDPFAVSGLEMVEWK